MTELSPLDLSVGLCSLCEHGRVVESSRGSTFWLCQQSDHDPALQKYPALPRMKCESFDLDVGESLGQLEGMA